MKNLNEIDVSKYFSKIGKKSTIIMFVSIILFVVIVLFGISKIGEVSSTKEVLKEKLGETEISELRVLKDKKELKSIEMELAELKETYLERDSNIQLMTTLKEIEVLMIKYAFNNTKHEVLPKRKNKDIFEIPVTIEFEGEYKKVVQFLQDINSTNLPIALKDLQIFILEEEYAARFQGTENVKVTVGIYIYENNDYVEKLNKLVEGDEKSNPFGYFIYDVPEDKEEGIDEYQKYLEKFHENLLTGEKDTEKNNDENAQGIINQGSNTNNEQMQPIENETNEATNNQ